MSKLTKPFKVIVLIISGIILIIGIIIVSTIYHEYNRSYIRPNTFGNNMVIYPNKGKVRLKSRTTNKYITPKLDYIFRNLNNPITVYKLDNRRGFLNQQSGKILIDSKKHNFSLAWEFDTESGLAAVVENNILGFIDTLGNYQIEPQFEYNHLSSSVKGFKFNNGYCTVSDRNGKNGIINASGNFVLKPTYSFISNEYSDKKRVVSVKSDNGTKYGLLDSCFSTILPLEYEKIEPKENGILVEKDNRKQLLSTKNPSIVLAENIWDNIEKIYYEESITNYKPIALKDYFKVTLNWHYGIIDSNGKVILEPVWDEINCLTPNLFEVIRDYNSFLVDENGRFIN